jgi:putative spermidine/putrescine transport system permease protein
MITVLHRAFVYLAACFIAAPIFVVVVTSFGRSAILEFPPSAWSFAWYGRALARTEFQSAALNSFWIATITTVIATPIALAAAFAIVRGRFPGRNAIQIFLMAPLVVPSIVIGLAILVFAAAIGVRVVEERLVAAHILITFPYLVRTIVASLSRVDPLAEEAARTLGANAIRAFWYVTLPALFPGLVAGMIFAFIVSFDNVSISLFLASARTTTLPLSILSYVETNLDPSVAAVSTLLVFLSLVTALLLERMVGLRNALGS